MIMRVSTATAFRAPVESMIRQQAEMERTQREISSGQKLRALAENPAQAARVSDLDRYLLGVERFSANADLAANRLKMGEVTISSGLDLLQRARELAVAGASDALDVTARKAIATEVRGIGEQLLSLANRRGESGEFIFAGSVSGAAPFVRTGGVVTYAGDSLEREIPISATRTIADNFSGDDIFVDITEANGAFRTAAAIANTGRAIVDVGAVVNGTMWGNVTSTPANPDYSSQYKIKFSTHPTTGALEYQVLKSNGSPLTSDVKGTYQSGQAINFLGIQVSVTGTPAVGDEFTIAPTNGGTESVFDTLDRLATALETPNLTGAKRAQISTDLGGIVNQLDQAIANFSDVRSSIGSRLNIIEESEAFAEEQEIIVKDTLSKLRDVDFAEALARLNAQMTALQVAQQAYAKISNRSLFDYL
jgi:flagellar hook-associated protein 3 FlgL